MTDGFGGSSESIRQLINAREYRSRGVTMSDLIVDLGLTDHAAGQARLDQALRYLREAGRVRAVQEAAKSGRLVWRYWPLDGGGQESEESAEPTATEASSTPQPPPEPAPARRSPGRPRQRPKTWSRDEILNIIAVEPEGLTMVELAGKLGVGESRKERVCLSTALHDIEAASRIERKGWRRLPRKPGRHIVWVLGPVGRGETVAAPADADPLCCPTCAKPLTAAELYELARQGRMQFCEPDEVDDTGEVDDA